MGRESKAKVIYSEDINLISSKNLTDWGIHVLCLEGEGSFIYNGKEIRFKKDDAMVISHPENVKKIKVSEELKIKLISAPFKFMYNLLPANHYGVTGCIDLFENPVIPLSEEDALLFEKDIENIKGRMGEQNNLFYEEMMGSLFLTMIYDLFNFHAKQRNGISVSERTGNVVKNLIALLEGGRTKQHREVTYYAEQLHLSPKYLSETVKRITGRSVTYLIDQYTVPMVADFLKNTDLSLAQIAEEMNFTTLSYFCRYVKKHLGMNPKEYRTMQLRQLVNT